MLNFASSGLYYWATAGVAGFCTARFAVAVLIVLISLTALSTLPIRAQVIQSLISTKTRVITTRTRIAMTRGVLEDLISPAMTFATSALSAG